jgi:hypothetical protein
MVEREARRGPWRRRKSAGIKARRNGYTHLRDSRHQRATGRLSKITRADVRREGFVSMGPREFVAMFCEHNKVVPRTMVNRIEFEYV